MRKVAAQEISSIDGLRKLYSSVISGAIPDGVTPLMIGHSLVACGEAVGRVLHCQNADWAIHILLHKYNITARDDLVGTHFESAKSWKTTHDPWRGVSRTSFGLDYLKHYECHKTRIKKEDEEDKVFELSHYDEEDQPRYGWDVYVQRLSYYIQHKEAVQDVPSYLEGPYNEGKNYNNPHKYVPDLQSLDNGNTIIIFENSQSGSIEDTEIVARQQWESRWRRLPLYLANESHDVWKSIAESWEDFLDVCNTHVSILEEKIYEQAADESRAPELWTNSSMWLNIEKLASIHEAVVNKMQNNMKGILSEGEVEDDWLSASPGDMKRLVIWCKRT